MFTLYQILLQVRPVVLRMAASAKRLAVGAFEIERCRVEERDRHLTEEVLSLTVERLFDGIGHPPSLADFLAEPSHGLVGVIERQLRHTRQTEAALPVAGMSVGTGNHQPVDDREIDRPLDMAAALARVLDEVEILVATDLLDADEHGVSPGLPQKTPQHIVLCQ